MPPPNFKHNLGKGGLGGCQSLLVLATFPEKTSLLSVVPVPSPKTRPKGR